MVSGNPFFFIERAKIPRIRMQTYLVSDNTRFTVGVLGTDYLPSASTCVNLLKMPPYETIATLEMKLREAIETNTFENT